MSVTPVISRVCLLEVKGHDANRIEKVGTDTTYAEKTDIQKELHNVARLQNFSALKPERPDWARGAFVYVTPAHASELRLAVEEYEAQKQLELKKHHMLVSDEYIDLVVDAFAAWPADASSTRAAYQASRPGMVKQKLDIPPPTFSSIEAHHGARLGPLIVDMRGIELTILRTFLHVVEDASDISRQTRSTGDRPKHIATELSSPHEQDKLPPPGADYGPLRKKNFHFLKLDLSGKSVDEVELVDVAEQACSEASYESYVTTFSLRSSDFYSAVDGDDAVIEQLALEFEEEIAVLRERRFPDLKTASVSDVRAHFMEGTIFFKRFIEAVFERAPPRATDCSTMSALESPLAMEKAVKRVGLYLGTLILNSLWVLTRVLNIPEHLGNAQFQESLKRGFVKAAAQKLTQDLRHATTVHGVSPGFLQRCILKVLEDVLHHKLVFNTAASLLAKVAKSDRRLHWHLLSSDESRKILRTKSRAARPNERYRVQEMRKESSDPSNAKREWRYICDGTLHNILISKREERLEDHREKRLEDQRKERKANCRYALKKMNNY